MNDKIVHQNQDGNCDCFVKIKCAACNGYMGFVADSLKTATENKLNVELVCLRCKNKGILHLTLDRRCA